MNVGNGTGGKGTGGPERRARSGRRSASRPSMAQVAAYAGVSHQTVSRVVNSSSSVKPATRQRIEAAIAELGYHRNNAARTLATHRSGLIGVIAVGSFLYGPTRTLVGIEEAARRRDFTTLLATIQPGRPSPGKGGSGGEHTDQDSLATQFDRAIGTCLDRSVEAIIVIAAQEAVVRHVSTYTVDVPLIVVGPPHQDLPGLATLSVDQHRGARAAIAHLGELGYRDVLLLTGPQTWIDAQQRHAGALAECAERGMATTTVHGDWSPARGYQVGQGLAADPNAMPSTVFAANDAMALGLLAAFNEAGIRVPGDVSLIGFDDIPEAAYFSPALTTVHQDFTTLGHRVLTAAAAAISGEAPDMTPVTPTITQRASTRRA